MAKIVEKNSIKIGKEPVVILPLKEWEEMKEYIEELEEKERYFGSI
jgi:PHD/YefM family antitoxin component YafN of YafNO toxin-antitoxin module